MVVMMQPSDADQVRMAASLSQFRRAMMRDFLLGALGGDADSELSLLHFGVLMHLEEAGPLSIKALAEVTRRSLSSASRLVDGLVTRGLVERSEDPRDRRAKVVALAELGRQAIMRLE